MNFWFFNNQTTVKKSFSDLFSIVSPPYITIKSFLKIRPVAGKKVLRTTGGQIHRRTQNRLKSTGGLLVDLVESTGGK